MITLRPFSRADLPTLGALFGASRASVGLFDDPYTIGEHTGFLAGLSHGADIMVAERAGAVAGFLSHVRKPSATSGMITHLYVHPDHQRTGVGSRLLRHALETHPGPLHLWCFEANAAGRALYEGHGFRQVERTDGSNNDEGLPDIRYVWDGVGSTTTR
ncbi:MAG: GNAT family N-acetyltransferase [Devosiaceae bacterium]|nr:GNAT family N-acetyltransferase [Devosiaceae bacterium MH13]